MLTLTTIIEVYAVHKLHVCSRTSTNSGGQILKSSLVIKDSNFGGNCGPRFELLVIFQLN